MTPTVSADAPKRLRRMHDKLYAAYGPQNWWPAQSPWEVVVGAYLTQNTAWKAVERSLSNLREAGVLTIQGLRTISLDDLQTLIRPSGFHTRKGPALKAFVTMLDDEFGGSLERMAATPVESLRPRLLNLPNVGPETADAILLYAFGHSVPVADEYLRRIVVRHRLIEAAPARNRHGYAALSQFASEAFAMDPETNRARLYNEFHALTVAVGKAHCAKTANCTGCPLAYDLKRLP